jgi:hypothetical protein
MSEFLKNKYFIKEIRALIKENLLKMSEFLKNKYTFNEIPSSYIFNPENDHFLKGKWSYFCVNF